MPRRIIYIKNPSSGSNFRTINADQSNATINNPRSRKPKRGPSNTQPPPFQLPTIKFPGTPGAVYSIDPAEFVPGFDAHIQGSKPSDFGYSLIDFNLEQGVVVTLPDWIFSDLQEGPGPQFENDPNWHSSDVGAFSHLPNQPINWWGTGTGNSQWTGYEGMEWATGGAYRP